MREDEAVESFASMFQAGFAAEPERIEKRQRVREALVADGEAEEARGRQDNENHLSAVRRNTEHLRRLGQAHVRPA